MFQLYRTNPLFIFEYQLFGERHSGTNFLQQCFQQKFNLPLTQFYGNKHWFGWAKPEVVTYKGRHTLFIGLVRNPYDWICAMHSMPHHIHPHRAYNFETYITSEWYSTWGDQFIEIKEDRNYITSERYKNIFEMRKLKYEYLLNTLPDIAQNYVLLSYEYFIKNHHNILNIIGNKFNLKTFGQPPEAINKSPYFIPSEIKPIIDSNIDWSLEEALGYYKI